MQTLNQEEIIRAVSLCKKADCKDYVTLQSLQKMLEVKRMTLMAYIDEHPKLFHCEEKFKTKYVKVKQSLGPGFKPIYTTEPQRGESLGLCIIDAYPTAADNPWTEEGLHRLIETNARTIWISAVDDYGVVIGYVINESKPYSDLEQYKDNRKNTWLWRNTHEKVQEILDKGYIKPKKFWKGGIGDSYSVDGNEITADGVKALEADGWTVKGKWF